MENDELTKKFPAMRQAAQKLGLPVDWYTPAKESTQIKAAAWIFCELDELRHLEESLKAGNAEHNQPVATLHIIFQGPKAEHWQYVGVPRSKVLGMLGAPSAGKYFNSEIKNHPAYTATKMPPVIIKEPLPHQAV